MRIRTAFFAGLLFALVSSGFAQEFWDKKPMNQWSRNDVKKLLENSPWSREFSISGMSMGKSHANDRGFEGSTQVLYRAQLRSAMPVRQAVVRQTHLDINYDSMKPEDKKAIDARADQYINLQFPDSIVFYVLYSSNLHDYAQEMAKYWTQQTTDLLKTSVFMITPKGQRVPLGEFRLAQGPAFQFTFPRPQDLEPEGTLKLEFTHPDLAAGVDVANATDGAAIRSGASQFGQHSGASSGGGYTGIGQTHVLIEFPLKKMRVGGKFEL
jgi:hypothetical protein